MNEAALTYVSFKSSIRIRLRNRAETLQRKKEESSLSFIWVGSKEEGVMEDGVTEDEQRAGPSSQEHLEDRKKKEEGRGEEEEDGGGGEFISHLISNFIHEKGTEEEDGEEKTEQSRDASIEDEKEGEVGGGGLIGHLITSFVSQQIPREGGRKRGRAEDGEVEERKKDRGGVEPSEAEGGGSGNTGGGVIGNIISSFLHHGEGGGGGDESREGSKAVGNGGGGGIIENIVSHFPSSLPEDAALTTDEAVLLLHSIVRD